MVILSRSKLHRVSPERHPHPPLAIVSSCNAPEVAAPTSQDQENKGSKTKERDFLVPTSILLIEPLLSGVENVSSGNAHLPCPLQVS